MWTEEMYQRLLESKTKNVSSGETADILNDEFGTKLTGNAVIKKFNREKRKSGKVGSPTTNTKNSGGKSTVTNKADGTAMIDTIYTMRDMKAKEPNDVLEAFGFKPSEWTVVSCINNFWPTTNGEGVQHYNFQTKISIKPITDELTLEKLIEKMIEEVKPVKLTKLKTGKRNLVIPIPDWHWGITKFDDVKDKLSEAIEIMSKGYETIVIEQLGDLYHSNQFKVSKTMNDTQLNDVEMVQAVEDSKLFFHLLITAALKHSKSVRVYHAEGNHSGGLEYMFLNYLEAKYPQVEVNYHNRYRDAYMLGNVGILITHGQYGKKKDYPKLFMNEFKSLWSKAVTTEIHSGHFHTLETYNDGGITHRQLATIKDNDNYEIQHGWTMNDKVWQIFEYNENRLKLTHNVWGEESD